MTDTIESPCISVCELDPGATYCKGCLRTMEEITRWGRMTPSDRRKIMNELAERRMTHAQVFQQG